MTANNYLAVLSPREPKIVQQRESNMGLDVEE